MEFIKEHNKEGHSYEVGVNQFADLTWSEFSSKYLFETPLNNPA